MDARHIFVGLLLAAMSTGVAAEWVWIASANNFGNYIDKSTIRRSGSIVRMWSMQSYNEPQFKSGKSFQSEKSQYEYDCTEERIRMIATVFYTQAYGKGDALDSLFGPSQWVPVVPDTIGDDELKIACSKKKLK